MATDGAGDASVVQPKPFEDPDVHTTSSSESISTASGRTLPQLVVSAGELARRKEERRLRREARAKAKEDAAALKAKEDTTN